MSEPLRIANCSGFYGDRLAAAREMVEDGPIDALTGEYLAELTMFILARGRAAGRGDGTVPTFLRQLEEVLGTCVERGIKVVANAGGLDPAAMAGHVRALAERLGLRVSVAHVEGDDLLARLPELRAAGEELRHLDDGRPLAALDGEPVTVNAYLGGWGIAEALRAGADVVISGRVTDAALVVGPAAWRFGWARDDWDRLAGAVAAGHVIECGTQATGGNLAFFAEVADLRRPGFPIAEVEADGSSVITKHAGTGGTVSVDSVTAQLVYEIGGPAYLNPDVVTHFDRLRLTQEGPDRVRIAGVHGSPPPPTLKVCVNHEGGHRNAVTVVIPGLDVEAKARLFEQQLTAALGDARPAVLETRLDRVVRGGPGGEACGLLEVQVKDRDRRRVGRAFSGAIVELALASFPGFHLTAPPGDAHPFGVHWPALIDAARVPHAVVLEDGRRIEVAPTAADPTAATAPDPDPDPDPLPPAPDGPVRRVPLGTLVGARSGDKGGNANVGVWARDDAAHRWLRGFLTVERLRELLPETAPLRVERHELPGLRALNFVIVGLLGDGVAASTRPDPQAKGLGEQLRAQPVDVPEALLTPPSTTARTTP
ncbi:acyclic terpene utilization AtuA family protein [Patulibacter defluvii]|uniref:acyclic terpene utilization AtuA family protein n=1 Tax=Patulibacter defluvii TaxID=3095358 RepID=UPI002A7597E6|nr:acyclic terpene utilization AtuA family protein [Patulibacter sp. DM4]